jgi:GH15 family glucan-1,4-alpha-glucosidase
MHSRIEDYAMIGDCQTAALVGLNGSIDWLCLPRFDSPSCFSSLLGTNEHGCYRISPSETINQTRRHYLDGSLILLTESATDSGSVELTDFLPIQQGDSHVVRLVRGLRGAVKMQLSLSVRFGYGRAVPWADKLGPGALSFVAGPDMLVLSSPVTLQGEDQTTSAHFTVRESECLAFVLSYGLSHLEPPKTPDVDRVHR